MRSQLIPTVKFSSRVVLALCLTACVCSSSLADEPEPPPPQTILDRLPPLPPPTEEQLRKGRELLDKIVYVIDNVPLTDAEAVLKVFGFGDLMTYRLPTYTRLVPRGRSGDQASLADLVGTGLMDIEAAPVLLATKSNKVAARLSASFSAAEACVSIDHVRERFVHRASKISSSRITDIHPVLRPTPANEIGLLGFRLLSSPFAKKTSITFVFEYQRCAPAFTFAYFHNEGTQQ